MKADKSGSAGYKHVVIAKFHSKTSLLESTKSEI